MIPAILLACALADAQQTPASADSSAIVPVVSIEHVRAALARPASKLTLEERTPDFRVNITEQERFARLVAPILDFKVGPGVPQTALFPSPFGSRSQPLFSVDLLSVAMAAAQGAMALQKVYAKRAAREEVRRTILAYCAAQPNGGAGILICDSSRTLIR